MSQDDVAYYRRRALEERSRAAHAENAEAANVHQALARRYEMLANQNDTPSGMVAE